MNTAFLWAAEQGLSALANKLAVPRPDSNTLRLRSFETMTTRLTAFEIPKGGVQGNLCIVHDVIVLNQQRSEIEGFLGSSLEQNGTFDLFRHFGYVLHRYIGRSVIETYDRIVQVPRISLALIWVSRNASKPSKQDEPRTTYTNDTRRSIADVQTGSLLAALCLDGSLFRLYEMVSCEQE